MSGGPHDDQEQHAVIGGTGALNGRRRRSELSEDFLPAGFVVVVVGVVVPPLVNVFRDFQKKLDGVNDEAAVFPARCVRHKARNL